MITNERLTEILTKGKDYATATYAEVVLDSIGFYASTDYNEERESENLQIQIHGEDLNLNADQIELVENFLYELVKQEIEDRHNEDAFTHNYENTGTNPVMFA